MELKLWHLIPALSFVFGFPLIITFILHRGAEKWIRKTELEIKRDCDKWERRELGKKIMKK